MTQYNGCGCGGYSECNSCTSNNEIQQAVNDALALEKENLEQYKTNAAYSATQAAGSAADAASSASAAAQSQTNAETAAGTATQAAVSVTDTAVVLEETAERIEQAQDLLEEQISAIQTKPVYFEVSTPTSSLVLPETETVFNVRSIYVASGRQDVGYGFTFDKATRTITLAEGITAEAIAETEEGFILITAICDVYSSDDPTSFPLILASNVGANNVGTSTGATVESRLTTLDSEIDPTLRQNLGSDEGLKHIGRCPSVAVLRTIEPSDIGQRINVVSYSTGWTVETGVPLGGGDFYYDPNDTTTPDDDIFVFVTVGGKRWKRDCSGKKILLEWKGIKPGDDATYALQSIGNYLKLRAKSAGTVAELPRVEIGAGTYFISDTIILTNAFRIYSVGYVELKTSSSWDKSLTKPIFSIENDSDIPNLPSPERAWGAMDPWFNGDGGNISIIGPEFSTANKCRGISVGNTVAGMAAVRGPVFRGVTITNCGDGLHLRMRRMYLTSFQNFNIWNCNTCLTIPTQIAEDSGERINFFNGVFGSALSQHVYNAMSPSLFFDHVSFDYCTGGDSVVLAGDSQYGVHSFMNCHWENIAGYFIHASTGGRVRIFITNNNMNPSQPGSRTAENAQSPSRVMIYLNNGGHVVINGLSLMQQYRPLTHENFLVAVGNTTVAPMTAISVNGFTSGDNAYTPCPVRAAVMNPSWDMAGETVGDTITNGSTYTTDHLIPAQESGSAGWSTGQTAVIIDQGDGSKALKISNPNNGNYAYLQTKEFIPASPGRAYSIYFSIQKLLATGDMNWAVGYYWYDKDESLIKTDVNLNGGFGSVYADTSLPGYSADSSTNGNRKISTTFGYSVAPRGAAYCRPFFRITNFLGDINVVNYVFWEAQ